MGVKGPDGAAGVPGEKVCLCLLMCDLTDRNVHCVIAFSVIVYRNGRIEHFC